MRFGGYFIGVTRMLFFIFLAYVPLVFAIIFGIAGVAVVARVGLPLIFVGVVCCVVDWAVDDSWACVRIPCVGVVGVESLLADILVSFSIVVGAYLVCVV